MLQQRSHREHSTELAEQGAPAFDAAQPILSQQLKAETAEREVRSVAYQLKVARFPAYRDLAGFDFSHHVARVDLRDARTVLEQLPAAFEHFNEVHPHSSLKMRSPQDRIDCKIAILTASGKSVARGEAWRS